jgi:hypothetical protein
MNGYLQRWLLIYFFTLTLVRSISINTTFNNNDLINLEIFYNNTNGIYWLWYDQQPGVPWDFSAQDVDPCGRWQGIGCICPDNVC